MISFGSSLRSSVALRSLWCKQVVAQPSVVAMRHSYTRYCLQLNTTVETMPTWSVPMMPGRG